MHVKLLGVKSADGHLWVKKNRASLCVQHIRVTKSLCQPVVAFTSATANTSRAHWRNFVFLPFSILKYFFFLVFRCISNIHCDMLSFYVCRSFCFLHLSNDIYVDHIPYIRYSSHCTYRVSLSHAVRATEPDVGARARLRVGSVRLKWENICSWININKWMISIKLKK